MIRYVLAVVLAVALLALSMSAIDRGATMNTERQVDASIAEIDEAATSLSEDEELSPDGHPNPRRVVDVQLPRKSVTAVTVDHFEIAPRNEGGTTVSYVLEDGTTAKTTVDETIVYADPTGNRSLELGGTGPQEVRLVLVPDENGDPIVVANPV